jgi:GT2 family glycosyltransferase
MASTKGLPVAALKKRIAKAQSFGTGTRFDLTLAVVSFNQWDISARFLRSLEHPQAPRNAELIWVDNGSTDGSRQRFLKHAWTGLGGFQRVRFVQLKRNYFISGAVNTALALAQGRFFIQADNDVLFAPGSLQAYLDALKARPDAYLSPLWQRTQNLLPRDFEPECYDDLPRAWERLRRVNAWLKPEEGAAAGSCWGADTTLLRQMGGWSEDYKLLAMDDDAIFRWRDAGRPAAMLPLPVFHPGQKTRGTVRKANDLNLADDALIRTRWAGRRINELREPRPWGNRMLSGVLGKILRGLRFF